MARSNSTMQEIFAEPGFAEHPRRYRFTQVPHTGGSYFVDAERNNGRRWIPKKDPLEVPRKVYENMPADSTTDGQTMLEFFRDYERVISKS
jgi:hypothetical protein